MIFVILMLSRYPNKTSKCGVEGGAKGFPFFQVRVSVFFSHRHTIQPRNRFNFMVCMQNFTHTTLHFLTILNRTSSRQNILLTQFTITIRYKVTNQGLLLSFMTTCQFMKISFKGRHFNLNSLNNSPDKVRFQRISTSNHFMFKDFRHTLCITRINELRAIRMMTLTRYLVILIRRFRHRRRRIIKRHFSLRSQGQMSFRFINIRTLFHRFSNLNMTNFNINQVANRNKAKLSHYNDNSNYNRRSSG